MIDILLAMIVQDALVHGEFELRTNVSHALSSRQSTGRDCRSSKAHLAEVPSIHKQYSTIRLIGVLEFKGQEGIQSTFDVEVKRRHEEACSCIAVWQTLAQ